jgi:hypothetical protein
MASSDNKDAEIQAVERIIIKEAVERIIIKGYKKMGISPKASFLVRSSIDTFEGYC